MKQEGNTMNNTLRWIKFESIMTADFSVNGISAPNFIRFNKNQLSLLEKS